MALELTLGRTELDGQTALIAMVRDVTERLAFERKLQDMAVRDTLTQVLNRRAVLDEVHAAWKEAQFARGALTVVAVDRRLRARRSREDLRRCIVGASMLCSLC